MPQTSKAKPSLAHRRPTDQDGSMGFLEHLDEFRSRLIKCCVAVMAGMVIAFYFHEQIANFIMGPSRAAMPAGTRMQTTRLGEGFAFYLDISLIAGALLAAPFVLFQVWRFIAPGLHANEKRVALPFVAMGVIGTLSGAAFAHYLMFPSIVEFFGQFDSDLAEFAPKLEDVFTQYKYMLLAMVAVFQLPTLVFFLARFRMVTARFLWDRVKYAILIIVIAAALLTPSPDPWNQAVLAAPMLAMYFLSIVIAWLAAPRRDETPAGSGHLRLVVAATVLDQARRHGRTWPT
jgi:sec-independent protein translocase protein TatC